MPRLPLNFSPGLSFRDQLLGLLNFLGLNSCACLDVLVISCFVKSNSLVSNRRRLALVLNSRLTNCLNFTECPADARSSIEMQKKQMSTVSKEDKEQEEEDADEEEEDEESEVLQCDSNPILLRLKKKKINGNGFEAGEPSAGIRGSKHKIERDPPPQYHRLLPTMHWATSIPANEKVYHNPPPPTSHNAMLHFNPNQQQ